MKDKQRQILDAMWQTYWDAIGYNGTSWEDESDYDNHE